MALAYHEQARADFERAHHWAFLHDLWATVARRPRGLRAYEDARRGLTITGESYRGVRAVPVDRIVGSLDRVADFDAAFRPRRDGSAARWQSIARAHYEGRELPPVRLYQVGDVYFVEDGHHRVSVARALGRDFVDAEVVEVRAVARTAAAASTRADRDGWRRLLGLGETGAVPALPARRVQECPI